MRKKALLQISERSYIQNSFNFILDAKTVIDKIKGDPYPKLIISPVFHCLSWIRPGINVCHDPLRTHRLFFMVA